MFLSKYFHFKRWNKSADDDFLQKGIKLNGKTPTILYGYGGFNISVTPNFSVVNAIWMENGGIYAVPNLRGGSEYGKNGTLLEHKCKRKTFSKIL